MSANDQAQHETLVPKGFRRVTPPQWGKVFSVTSRVTVSRERAGALLRGQGLSQETIDIRFAIDALLRSRDIQQIDGPASACFWAGGTSGAWFAYTQYANGQIQPEAAPRVRDRALGSVAELITNAVRTFASLLENRHARGEPMPSTPPACTSSATARNAASADTGACVAPSRRRGIQIRRASLTNA